MLADNLFHVTGMHIKLDFFPIDKFSRYRASLNIFLCIDLKYIPYIHSTISSDEFEIGQVLDRN